MVSIIIHICESKYLYVRKNRELNRDSSYYIVDKFKVLLRFICNLEGSIHPLNTLSNVINLMHFMDNSLSLGNWDDKITKLDWTLTRIIVSNTELHSFIKYFYLFRLERDFIVSVYMACIIN